MTKPTIIGKPLDQDQMDIVKALNEALELALKGEIKTIGILVCFAEGFGSGMAGRDAGALNLAADDLKYKIHGLVTAKTEERQSRRSSIIKPVQ